MELVQPSPTEDPQRSFGWRTALLTALVIWVVFAYTATRSSLWDRDEPRFATAALEMIQSGNYLVPTFNGRLRAAKPILIYWLMTASVKLLGPNELGVRFWAPLATALSALMTYWLGRRLISPRAGWWAMAALATCPLMLMTGTAATTDAVLLACILLAIVGFVLSCLDGARWWHIAMLAIGTGLALLNKGPVGLAVIALTMLVTAWMGRGRLRLGGRYWLWAGLALLGAGGMFLAWALPANARTEGQFARTGLGRDVWQRMMEPAESHGGPVFYYIIVVLLGFSPWTLQLFAGARTTLVGRCGQPDRCPIVRVLLLGWFVPSFLLMSLIATKLPHYILPVFPAMALAVGSVLETARRGQLTPGDHHWMRLGVWFYGPVTTVQGLALTLLPLGIVFRHKLGERAEVLLELAKPLMVCAPVLGVVILLVGTSACVLHWRGRYARAAQVLVLGVLVIQILLAASFLPATEAVVKLSPRIAGSIRSRTMASSNAGEKPVFTFHYAEASLNFYLGGRQVTQLGDDAAVAAWAKQPGEAALVISRTDLDRIEETYGKLPLHQLNMVRGINIVNGHYHELLALWRSLEPCGASP